MVYYCYFWISVTVSFRIELNPRLGKLGYTFSDEIETSTDILIPKGSIDTQISLPYIFSSMDEF